LGEVKKREKRMLDSLKITQQKIEGTCRGRVDICSKNEEGGATNHKQKLNALSNIITQTLVSSP